MSIICNSIRVGDLEALFILAPHRWRVTIWRGAKQVRRMHDKDGSRIIRRAIVWMTAVSHPAEGESDVTQD